MTRAPGGGAGGSPYRWVVLAVGLAVFLQTHLHRMAFAPLIPTFVADLGLTYAAAGIIQTAYFWTYAAAQVPIGMIADRWGSRRVMLACLACLAVGALAFGASRTYVESVSARMLVGLGAAGAWVPGMRLLSEWFHRDERGWATGLMSAGGGLGGTLGFVLVPLLASAWGWRATYGAMALPALVTLAVVALALGPGGSASAGAREAGSLRRVLTTRALWPINLSMLFSYGGFFSFVTFLPAFLVTGMGLSQTEAGLVTSLIMAGTIASWPLAGVLSDRLGRRKPLILLSQAASIAGCLAFALFAERLGLVGAAAVALAMGVLIGGLILPFVIVVELFPPALAGTAAGVTNTACFCGGMILPILLGAVVDFTGSFTAAFLVAAAVQVLAFFFALFVRETSSGYR